MMSVPSIFEYLPKEASAVWKMAEAEKNLPEKPIRHGLKTVASGLGGMAVGTLLGYGGGALAGKAYNAVTGKRISPELLAIPASLAGAGLGAAYRVYKAKELEELQRAAESHRNKSKGAVPGQ